MEIRAAKSVNVLQRTSAPSTAEVTDTVAAGRATAAHRPSATRRTKGSRVSAPHAVVLTREQEYAFIRQDLRRLVILSAVLIVAMVVTLFILEAL